MPRLPAQLVRTSIVWLVMQPAATAAEKAPLTIESSEGQFVLSLLPKSFQKNPATDRTVITEMTEEGKRLEPPSRENPAYYVAQSGGFHAEGHGSTDLKMPPAAEMEGCLRQALSVNHYLPAGPGHPPSLLILYHWGLHSTLDQGSTEADGSAFPDVRHRNLLSRAALVGGNKFAAELRTALERQDREDEVKSTLPTEFGSMLTNYGPLRRFTDRDPKTMQLYEESLADCYYVIASVYDYPAATQGQRKLLWRSKMTVDAQGVAMADTLSGLILNAGRYFGRDMPEAATMIKRVTRETQTRLGPLEVKEYIDNPAGHAAEKIPDPPPKTGPKP
jgi:hypothetical protein